MIADSAFWLGTLIGCTVGFVAGVWATYFLPRRTP